MVDYSTLADLLLKKTTVLLRSHSHKKIGEFAEGEMFILKHLSFTKGKALPSDLAAAMNTSSSRIAAILNSLERKGLVSREIDETDRRRILVGLTPAGQQLLQRKQKMLHDSMEYLLRRLGEHDSAEVLRLLDRFIEIYGEMNAPEHRCCDKGM